MRIAKKSVPSIVAAVTLLTSLSVMPAPSYAYDGGAIALGAIGGLAAGAMLGSALSGPRYYAPPPPPVYRSYYPAYEPVYADCIRRRVWGPYGWHWITDCQ